MGNESYCNYDLVVIGAGVSGLSLAASLPALSILILEAEDRVGGRVYSCPLCDIAVELGAIFPLVQDNSQTPAFNAHNDQVGLYQAGELCTGAGPIEALKCFADSQAANSLQDGQPVESGDHFYDSLFKIISLIDTDADLQASRLYRLTDAFHRVIHPGPMSLYSPSFARHALVNNWPCQFNDIPNSGFVDSILARLGSNVELRTGCKVTRLTMSDDSFVLEATGLAGTFHVRARHCVITTPVRQMLHMLRGFPDSVADFYRNIVYVPGIVCAMVLDDLQDLPKYVVSADQPWSTMIPMIRGGRTVFHFYITDTWVLKLWSQSDDSISSLLIESVRGMGVASNCLGSIVQRWTELGPILSDNLARHYQPNHHQLARGLWFAGEMALYKPSMPIAYGVTAGVRAGEMVAFEIQEYLASSRVAMGI